MTLNSSYLMLSRVFGKLADAAHAVGDWLDNIDHEMIVRGSPRDWAVRERARRAAVKRDGQGSNSSTAAFRLASA